MTVFGSLTDVSLEQPLNVPVLIVDILLDDKSIEPERLTQLENAFNPNWDSTIVGNDITPEPVVKPENEKAPPLMVVIDDGNIVVRFTQL